MGLRDEAEELVRAHQLAASQAETLVPWSDPEMPEWCSELTTAIWRRSFRPSPVYYRMENPSHAWRGPAPVRLHHLGFGWQLTACRAGQTSRRTVVVLETGSLWQGLGYGQRAGRRRNGTVDGLQPGHDGHFAVRGFDDREERARTERRLLFGVAGLAALMEDAVQVGPHGELEWSL
ncbi:hypothetical protein [Rathayibacter toxicus]|uniref:Uncharacterized protein n=1 Tax=Rathayibacter toxicus TaxID=145458 RepID=A0A0C5BRJ8_9MICO|nr:hypothetical protein [Rathayibacter toxicus]AJM77292.1 hypothetical protein TI83_03605 [Rathayibacter toxicus]ALS56839.1 hypothetical protein APU90_02865 [Rathayibacter toxicus]KKM46318.1 hypothetical protein VT73_04625 [Rathayibacter toxicus]PPG23295.1 hypothetical protein C5D15_03405 [Rathayibacter toxicus]PPG47877.1 hypothetical protein C5D16_03395 [Rathayibacter toxicus]